MNEEIELLKQQKKILLQAIDNLCKMNLKISETCDSNNCPQCYIHEIRNKFKKDGKR